MWDKLNRITGEYKRMNLQDVLDYEKFCIISIMWHSTKIEGCSLSETDTRVLLEYNITASGKPMKDHLMIKDTMKLLCLLSNKLWRSKNFG